MLGGRAVELPKPPKLYSTLLISLRVAITAKERCFNLHLNALKTTVVSAIKIDYTYKIFFNDGSNRRFQGAIRAISIHNWVAVAC